MSDFQKGQVGGECPQEGDVAEFVDLHLATLVQQGKHPHKTGEWVYRVDGKPRPMLVLTRLKKPEQGRVWFVALPITTKGRDEKGEVKEGHMPIGDCIEQGRESFLRLVQQKLPENMLYRGGRRSPVRRPCDREAWSNVLKIVNFKSLRGEM